MAAVAEASASHLADELIDHAVSSIKAADYSASPYPHIFFRNFFPADFYRDLTAAPRSVIFQENFRFSEDDPMGRAARAWHHGRCSTATNGAR